MATQNDLDAAAMRRCVAFGLHPKARPLGDGHHSDGDTPFSPEDEAIGDALAYFLGTLFADVQDQKDWFYTRNNSVDEWRRVARALRIHGLRIANGG